MKSRYYSNSEACESLNSQKPEAKKNLADALQKTRETLGLDSAGDIPKYIASARLERTQVYRFLSGHRQIKVLDLLIMCEHMKVDPIRFFNVLLNHYYGIKDGTTRNIN